MGTRGKELVRQMVARGVAARPQEYARLNDLEALTRLYVEDPSVVRLDAVMMGAVDFGHHDLVSWLLARGASANARSDAASRHSALHSAAWNGDLRMARILVEAGADRESRDAQYEGTPRGWAKTSLEVTNNAACAEVAAFLA